MTDSNPTAGVFGSFRAYWHCLVHTTGTRLWQAVALLVATGVLDGFGLFLLLPMLGAVGVPETADTSGAAGAVWRVLRGFDVPFTLPALLVIFAGVKTAQAALRAYSGLLSLKLETDFTGRLRTRFYRAMMEANWLFVTRQRSSDLSQALLDELPRVGMATRLLLTLMGAALLALVQVAVAWVLSPVMTMLAVGAGTVVALGLRRLRRRVQQLARLGQNRRAEMAATVSEHLAGIKIAKSHGRESQHFHHFQAAVDAIAAHTLRLYRASSLTRIWLELGGVVALGLFVWFAVEVRQVNTARLLVLAYAFSRLLGHVSGLQASWHQFAQALPSFTTTEQLRQRLAAAAEPPAPAAPRRMALHDEIRLAGVTFQYDPAQPAAALRKIDLVLPARQVTALCGPSGAGKSTLADLVLGLLAPTAGRVLLDGVELAGARLHDWRQSVGYVPQETFLFHETVRSNLLWARPDAPEADLRAALRAAAAEEFVDALPQGLDTIVGDRGVRLSGGERQRIALARALLRRPTLLVLDEATSALDTRNERLVQDAIEKLHGELTIVVIAHRLSTVRFADRIVVLEKGEIIETGTWDDLHGRAGGAFRRLAVADASA